LNNERAWNFSFFFPGMREDQCLQLSYRFDSRCLHQFQRQRPNINAENPEHLAVCTKILYKETVQIFRIPAHLQRNPIYGIFYFRLTVPKHIRHIVGLLEIKSSLRTGMKSEAQVLAQKNYYDAMVLFANAEKQI
jgi:hypothetical protein